MYPFLPTSKSLAYVILILTFVFPSCVFSVDERHALCSVSFDCVNKKNLSYPFWIPGREDCGHPDFELNCTGDSPEINISSVNFRVLDVRYELHTLRLDRTDYISNLCPQNLVNTTFNKLFFSLLPSSTELLTFYYECSDISPSLPSSGYIGGFSCDNYQGKGYYVTRNLSSPLLSSMGATLDDFKGFCRRNITIPVDESALTALERGLSPENLQKVLDQGFSLQWYADDGKCLDCVRSNGACGYSRESKEFVCYCTDKRHKLTCAATASLNWVPKAAGVIGSVAVLFILTLLCKFRGITFLFWKSKAVNDLSNQNVDALIPLKRYSYREIKKITKSFTNVVGRGGFGTVYRGQLPDGCNVAVKVLKDSNSNGEDFINEVASMSKTSHVNIVSLLGFCYEASKRAIVYEFVENGSLDRFISNKSLLRMDWRTLHEIAVGVARGLEYLHYGCKTRIVHFDIKPQNILLDDNLCPKVSDFGLAKLCDKKESIMSLLDARGTIGYIAPEVFSRNYGRVSHKSDVYSYGMLVLEMIGARNNERIKNYASESSSMYFPDWIYKDLERGENMVCLGQEVANEDEEEMAKKMTIVGLWCIQSCPSDRPPMNKVVEMLEGSLNALEVPTKPSLRGSVVPFRESSQPSEENSSSSYV